MTDLASGKCIACRADEPTLTNTEIAELQPQIPDWRVKKVDDMKRLARVFKFKNSSQLPEFTNQHQN